MAISTCTSVLHMRRDANKLGHLSQAGGDGSVTAVLPIGIECTKLYREAKQTGKTLRASQTIDDARPVRYSSAANLCQGQRLAFSSAAGHQVAADDIELLPHSGIHQPLCNILQAKPS
eukprot:360216-Pelagomonas_calceolata.AAC.5